MSCLFLHSSPMLLSMQKLLQLILKLGEKTFWSKSRSDMFRISAQPLSFLLSMLCCCYGVCTVFRKIEILYWNDLMKVTEIYLLDALTFSPGKFPNFSCLACDLTWKFSRFLGKSRPYGCAYDITQYILTAMDSFLQLVQHGVNYEALMTLLWYSLFVVEWISVIVNR